MSSILLQMTVIIGSTRVQLRLAQLCLWVVGSVGCILCVWLKLLAHTVALVMSVFWCVWAVVTLWPLHRSTLASVQVFCWSCRAHSFSGTAFHCKSVSHMGGCRRAALLSLCHLACLPHLTNTICCFVYQWGNNPLNFQNNALSQSLHYSCLLKHIYIHCYILKMCHNNIHQRWRKNISGKTYRRKTAHCTESLAYLVCFEICGQDGSMTDRHFSVPGMLLSHQRKADMVAAV